MTKCGAVLLACLLALAGGARTAMPADVVVFAAASLKDALDVQARQFESATGSTVTVAYAGSNALARQIEAGAPADLFVSADIDWMDAVEKKALLRPGSRVDLLRNALVLIAPASSTATLKIAPRFALSAAIGNGRLAMANPDSVPAGRYGKAALEALGVWTSVEGKVARAENVRAAMAFVARGEAPFGIVYATDAKVDPRVRIVDAFPQATYPPVVYPAAILASSRSAAAKPFLDFLRSVKARATWEKYGFGIAG